MSDTHTPETEEEATAGHVSPSDLKTDEPPTPHDLGIELPEDEHEAIQLLLVRLAQSREESSTYLEDLKRVAADFENFRKRTMREQGTMLDRAAERVIQKLLPALDSFDAAAATEVESEAGQQLLTGMLNTREQLMTALSEEGLEAIPTVGESFDPELHEPIGAPGGNGDLVVSQELRRGYLLNGRLIRAALVTLEHKES